MSNEEICTDCSVRADLAQATARADDLKRQLDESSGSNLAECRAHAETTQKWQKESARADNAEIALAAYKGALEDVAKERDLESARADSAEKDFRLTLDRADREAQLACDLRGTQDEIIERCAKAVEEWPDAAQRLRTHCGLPDADNCAVSGEDFGKLKRQLSAETARAGSAVRAQAEVMRENERLREGLKRLEWSKPDWNNDFHCPACDAWDGGKGHKPDCWLNALIGGGK
jgi:hypothetical protein